MELKVRLVGKHVLAGDIRPNWHNHHLLVVGPPILSKTGHINNSYLIFFSTNDLYFLFLSFKGTVSRDGRGMLLYIFRKLLKKEKKHDFVKGPVNHEHLKDSALYQVLYSK